MSDLAFCGVSRGVHLLDIYRRFGTPFTLIDCPAVPPSHYRSALFDISDEHTPHLHRGGGLKLRTGAGENPRKCFRATGALSDVRTSYILNAIQALLLGAERCNYLTKTAGIFRSQIFCSAIEIIHGFTRSLQGQCGANGVVQNALQIADFIHNVPFPCPLTFLEMRLQKLRNGS